MRTRFMVGLAAISALAAGTAAAQNMIQPYNALTWAETEFAIDLYGQLSQRPGNLVFSPYSVANALDMVYMGAKGATADEIAGVLHLQELGSGDLPSTLTDFVQRRRLFYYQYASPGTTPVAPPGDFQFEDADALWASTGERFEPDYLASVKDTFGGDVRKVDFADAPVAAARINAWVTEKTQGRITGLISAGQIPSRTRMVLTDAVYFKAGWAVEFDEAASKPAVFHVTRGQDVTVRMMHAAGHFSMTRGDGMEMLDIPYRYGDASLLIILPDDRDGLPAIESELTVQKLTFWREYAQQFNVAMSIPTFTTASNLDLVTVLQTLGIKHAFKPFQADLRGISDSKGQPLYVGDVVHKAFIDVNEKGTEAAAATAVVGVAAAGMEPPVEDVSFIADHPFIYIIRANGSGDILFMGRVENPAQGGG